MADDPGTKDSARPSSKTSKTSKPEDDKKKGKDKPGKKTAGKGAPKTKPAESNEEQGDEGGNALIPIFISSKSQAIFGCVAEEDVTEDSPNKLVPKEAIIQDMKERAAVSDFHPIKQLILDYPGDEVLLIYDADFKYGQNFVLVSTEEEKLKIIKPAVTDQLEEGEVAAEGVDAEGELEEVVYTYIPPVSKEWVSQGSEKEIEESAWKDSEQKIHITIKRRRREFGAPIFFTDRDADDAKDGYMECVAYEDKSFGLKMIELDKDVQAVPMCVDQKSQTEWKHPCNKYTQYSPREFTEEERQTILSSEAVNNFVNRAAPRFELALQQNEIMDVFQDDWSELGNEDDTFGSKSDNHLKEYQSFTDLHFSRDKVLTCIEWHPTIKGIIAVSCAESMTFDERIDNSSKILMSQSLVLIWSFVDPIHPQILLEAPEDVFCLKFNPTDPNIIAGGCVSGQIVLWDISKHMDRLKNTQQGKQSTKKNMINVPGFEDDDLSDKTPVVRYCASAAIEHGHKSAVSDIQWLPDHMEVNRFGVIVENRNLQCCQLLSASADGNISIWDTRPAKGQTQAPPDTDSPFGVANTFKHLDLTWKPVIKIHMSRLEGSGYYGPVRVSLQERQGDRTLYEKMHEDDSGNKGGLDRKDSMVGGGLSFRASSAKDKKPLEGATTKFYIGTEEGELIYTDLKLEKDPDSGRMVPPSPDFVKSFHDRSINTLMRSPFFKDILLVVGGWNFSIWKEGRQSNPLLMSSASSKQLTCGFWSPTRPGVFYLGTSEGNVEVWDLLDRTHQASLSQNISASAITSVYPWHLSAKQQLLAVSDKVGTLHILEVPWTLRNLTHGEVSSVSSYFEREDRRLEYQEQRVTFHHQNKQKLGAEEAERKMAQPPEPSTEEVDNMMRGLWVEYVEEEKKFLKDLGLLEEKDEPLPEV